MQTEKSTIVGSLDAGLNGTRLEVIVTEREGLEVLALQLSTWNEALGWQAQKTIPLAANQLGQLQRLLSQARACIEEQHAPVNALAQVIPLAARGPAGRVPVPLAQPAGSLESVAS